MQYDIAKMIDGLEPWQMSVKINNVDYPIRPVLIGELGASSPADFFADPNNLPKPFTSDMGAAVLAAVAEYIKFKASKNFPALLVKAQTQRAAQMTAGA